MNSIGHVGFTLSGMIELKKMKKQIWERARRLWQEYLKWKESLEQASRWRARKRHIEGEPFFMVFPSQFIPRFPVNPVENLINWSLTLESLYAGDKVPYNFLPTS